jgi:ketosteroid isomerase-like protein
MSQENVEVVRRVFDAVERRDSEAALALYDADFEWDFSRVPWGDVAGPGVHRGRDALPRIYREWHSAWADYEEKLEELIDAGESVVSVLTGRGRGRASGVEVEMTVAGVWTVRDGQVIRSVWFPTREEALEAVGLQE